MVSESVSCPVSMMIGALKPPLRKLRTTSRPSVSGSPTSISTRSGALALAALAPLAPVSTAEASNSSCSDNCSTSVSRRSVSSSTIRILRALAMGTILSGGGCKRKRLQPCVWVGEVRLRQVLVRLEERRCYRFTSRATLYPRIRGHLDECPVMGENGRGATVQDTNSMKTVDTSNSYKVDWRDRPFALIRIRPAAGD